MRVCVFMYTSLCTLEEIEVVCRLMRKVPGVRDVRRLRRKSPDWSDMLVGGVGKLEELSGHSREGMH